MVSINKKILLELNVVSVPSFVRPFAHYTAREIRNTTNADLRRNDKNRIMGNAAP